jgi:WD40 repeat protein
MGIIAVEYAKFSNERQFGFLEIKPRTILESRRSSKIDVNKYFRLLTDFDFISLKINHPKLGVEPLVGDYDLIDAPQILDSLKDDERLSIEQIKILKLIQGTLRLSAHVLNQDPNQLVGQLWGRLQCFNEPAIQNLLEEAKQSYGKFSQFRPINASFTTPNSPLISTFLGHQKSVWTVAITPDGKKAISGSDDNTLKVWNLNTAKEIFTLIGHEDSVRAIAITPDGKKAISSSDDNTLKVWDLDKGKVIFTIIADKDPAEKTQVRILAITPDGKKAISNPINRYENGLKDMGFRDGKGTLHFC